MFPILLKIGPLTLHTYGLMAALGIFAGLKILTWAAAQDGYAGKEAEEPLYSLTVYLIAGGILGARIFYVATHWGEFQGDLLSVFKIWQGGLVFYGGLILAGGSFFAWHRRHRALFPNWKQVADWIAPSMAFGHAFGRLGCFAAGCCYGTPTALPWAVTFTDPECLAPTGIPLHPTQIYEFTFLSALSLFLLWRLSHARKSSFQTPGAVFLDYVLMYCAGRFMLDFFRADEPRLSGLSPGQITSIVIFIASVSSKFFLTKTTRSSYNK